jgi:hypothetical protein
VANEILNSFNKIVNVIRNPEPRKAALVSVLGPHKDRIFSKGQAADGTQIGTYTPETAKRKSAKGRNPGYVNLRDTDQMMGDYGIVPNGDGFGFGFQNGFNADKMEWNEKRYNKDIAALSDSEFETYVKVLVAEINK